MEELEGLQQTINVKGLKKIESYFDLDEATLAELDAETLKHLYNMARLGMQFTREMNVQKRATEMNYIRLAKLVSENREEMTKYLKRTLPVYMR